MVEDGCDGVDDVVNVEDVYDGLYEYVVLVWLDFEGLYDGVVVFDWCYFDEGG